MIVNAALENILKTATDMSIVCELYASDAIPGAGFNPTNAIECYAATEIVFGGKTYKRLVESFGGVDRSLDSEINSTTVTFSNHTGEISRFELDKTKGFEGKILVVRLLSRSLSIAITDTYVLFAGRCERPDSGDKKSLTVTAKFILGSIDPIIPRRKFGKEDPEGRVSTDPEFEGFIFMPREGATAYTVRERRRNPWGLLVGLVGFFFIKKTVNVSKTLNWSSYSDLDASKSVPEIFGAAQILGTHISYEDVGTTLRIITAWCEGEISEIVSLRSLDSRIAVTVASTALGKVGVLNGPLDPVYPGDGYHSRTAFTRLTSNNTTIAAVDPAPDVAAVVRGRKTKTPHATTGVWDTVIWNANAASAARFLFTSPDYYKLNEGWVDDVAARESYLYNAELIFDMSISDYIFVPAS